MKLLLINYEFPPLGGGAGNATKHVAHELAKLGHTVCVLTTWFAGVPEDEETCGYRVVRVRSRRKRKDRSTLFEMLHFVWCARKRGSILVQESRPDVIISFFALPTGLIAWYLKWHFGIPYIISLRGGDVPGFLHRNLKYHHFFSQFLTSLVWRQASAIVANSKGLTELAQKTAQKFAKKVIYIPNGVDTETFSPQPDLRAANKLTLLIVGRLTEQKGVSFLLKAIKTLIGENPYLKDFIRCHVVGDGPLRAQLEAETKEYGLLNNVSFFGWCERSELPAHYRTADVFVLPSYDEGMANVILEAMASGLPIIATDIPGNQHLVVNRENGFLYKNHDELSGLINAFIINPSLKETFGQASRLKAEKFSWHTVAQEYQDICMRIP